MTNPIRLLLAGLCLSGCGALPDPPGLAIPPEAQLLVVLEHMGDDWAGDDVEGVRWQTLARYALSNFRRSLIRAPAPADPLLWALVDEYHALLLLHTPTLPPVLFDVRTQRWLQATHLMEQVYG